MPSLNLIKRIPGFPDMGFMGDIMKTYRGGLGQKGILFCFIIFSHAEDNISGSIGLDCLRNQLNESFRFLAVVTFFYFRVGTENSRTETRRDSMVRMHDMQI